MFERVVGSDLRMYRKLSHVLQDPRSSLQCTEVLEQQLSCKHNEDI